jgi:radical SAM superfamily enzyme YgiQ (UPF0313 family)
MTKKCENNLRDGCRIVLTADRTLMSHYYNFSGMGFASALPCNLFPSHIMDWYFPLKSDEHGRMLAAQLGICKIEAALLDYGFSADDVIISDPTKLDLTIGPRTKAIGIGTLDPLGLSYGAKVCSFVLRRFGLKCKESIMSKSFQKLMTNPALRRYKPKIIVGGQGVWQIVDSGMQEKLGIDCIIEGEGEGVAGKIFQKAIWGQDLPKIVKGEMVSPEKAPIIRTPSRCGIVEITRGCGRHCMFCAPGTLPFRSFQKERILEEIRLNVKSGISGATLQSEDALLYGSDGSKPNPEAVLDLLKSIHTLDNKKLGVGFEFFSVSSIIQNPKLVEDMSEFLGLRGNKYSVVEVGVETGSSRLLSKYMPGKVRPFRISDWRDMVLSSAKLLHSNNWRVCYSFILGLPGETKDDVLKSLELVDELKPYNCVIVPIVFMPAGSLRRKEDFSFELMTEERWELFQTCIEQTLSKAPSFLESDSTGKKIRNAFVQAFFYLGILRMRSWTRNRRQDNHKSDY